MKTRILFLTAALTLFALPVRAQDKPDIHYCLVLSTRNVDEGSGAITLTGCLDSPTGAPGDNPVYTYAWRIRPGSSTPNDALSLLSATDVKEPVFLTPDNVDQDTWYQYEMVISAENANDFVHRADVFVINKPQIVVTCANSEVYAGSGDLSLSCSASGAPAGSTYAYAWTARGNTPDIARLISGRKTSSPTFRVPDNVSQDTRYEYTLTVSAPGADDGTADVTVTVLRPIIELDCKHNDLQGLMEGFVEDFELGCRASGAPGANPVYAYAWTARGNTPNTDRLSATDVPWPTFYMPDVDADETYEYTLTVSAPGADDGTEDFIITILNKPQLVVACPGNPYSAYEGSEDFELSCMASGKRFDENDYYAYEWAARGNTPNMDRLRGRMSGQNSDVVSLIFKVPENVGADETYEYTVTFSAWDRGSSGFETAEPGTAHVTVTVLNNTTPLSVTCANPDPVREGSPFFRLSCSAAGAVPGKEYTYAWTARGNTPNTDLLSASDVPAPTFYVPHNVPQDTRYEYTLTATTAAREPGTAHVTVTVLDTPSPAPDPPPPDPPAPDPPVAANKIAVRCIDSVTVYENSKDFQVACLASGAPATSAYKYEWTPIGSTNNLDQLHGVNDPNPIFLVPEDVQQTTIYEYRLTVSAEDATAGSDDLAVFVLNARSDAPCADDFTLSGEVCRLTPVSVEPDELPETVRLAQNYPNPFNPTTSITYELPSPGPVRLEVFDATGRSVAVLADGVQPAGRHSVRFDASGLPSGLYVYRLQAGGAALTRKMTLIR